MRQSLNNKTGTIHYITSKTSGPANLLVTLCGQVSGMFWRNTLDEPTCLKCLAIRNGQKLKRIGDAFREMQTRFLRKFKEFSKDCVHRKAYQYRQGPDFISWSCTKKTDPFGWGCNPDDCPYVGYLLPSGEEWNRIETPPKKEDLNAK